MSFMLAMQDIFMSKPTTVGQLENVEAQEERDGKENGEPEEGCCGIIGASCSS